MALMDELEHEINESLNALEWVDNPFVYDYIHSNGKREKMITWIKEKVIIHHREIGDAIIEIDNDLNPNHID